MSHFCCIFYYRLLGLFFFIKHVRLSFWNVEHRIKENIRIWLFWMNHSIENILSRHFVASLLASYDTSWDCELWWLVYVYEGYRENEREEIEMFCSYLNEIYFCRVYYILQCITNDVYCDVYVSGRAVYD